MEGLIASGSRVTIHAGRAKSVAPGTFHTATIPASAQGPGLLFRLLLMLNGQTDQGPWPHEGHQDQPVMSC